jgi:2-desacetyl-2-hydroxyethyl bacteriochlorophyllide A dehydrogenase
MLSRLRELWFTAPGAVELREGLPAQLATGQVRVRALASGISQGTELLLWRGEGPEPFDPSLDAASAPTYPRRYGYAWVGEIVETCAVDRRVGERVFALLAHGDEHCVVASAARRLPPELPAERATLAANLETAVNVVWDAGIGLGDDVLVVGGGVVGLLAGQLARRAGASRVRLVEPLAARRLVAETLGFDAALSPEQLIGAAEAEADVVIEATGRPECLDLAIAQARSEGVVAVASFYGQRVAPVSLGVAFHRRRLTLRASQVSHLPPSRAGRWSFDRRFELVCELLRDPRLDALLERPIAIADAAAVYARLAAAPQGSLQVVFHYV